MTFFKRHAARSSRRRKTSVIQRVSPLAYDPAADPLGLEIQAVLRVDRANGAKLMYGAPEQGGRELDGYCAAAAASYFFLKGEELAGLDPVADPETIDWAAAGAPARAAGYGSFQFRKGEWSHWWLEHGNADDAPSRVIDLTVSVGEPPIDYPYELGHGRGFMMTGYQRPAKRALAIITLVKEARLA
jgi:hypothetical protein